MPSKECAVCFEPASLRCAKCKVVEDVLLLIKLSCLWPTHKLLCGKDPNRFLQANLTRVESDFHKQMSAASGSGSQISRLGGTIEQALRKRFPGQDPFEMAWERFQENLRTATPDERDTMIVRRRLWILNFDPSFTGRVGLPIYPFYRNAEITKAVTFGNRPIPAPLLARLQHQTYNFYTLSFLIESPPQPPSTLEVQHINRSLDRMFEASRDVGKAGGDELADIFEETSRLTRLDYRKLVRMLEGMDAEEARWLWQQEVEAERAVIKEEQEAKKRAASSGT